MTLDADYVCDSYSDVYLAAIDVQQLLQETYGMATTLTQTFLNRPNNTPAEPEIEGYQVTGKQISKQKTIKLKIKIYQGKFVSSIQQHLEVDQKLT